MIEDIISKLSSNYTHVVYFYSFSSPVGIVTAIADDQYLYIVAFEDTKNLEKKIETLSRKLKCKIIKKKNKILDKFEEELSDYFQGNLMKFTVPVKTFGTQFQNAVWNKLIELPYGLTQTYADVAKSLGRDASHSRAVGGACGANPLLLVVPCHRLVAVGSKGGYNSGVDRKDKLLQHEKKLSTIA